MKLLNASFIRLTCLSLDEQKTMKTMYMGHVNDIPQAAGPVIHDFNKHVKLDPAVPKDTNKTGNNEASVMDREEPDENDFKQLDNDIQNKKQELISRLDDAIKGGLFDQDTKDKLLMHVIQVVKEYYNRYKVDFEGMSQEEIDTTLRDTIEYTYHSLVYKTNNISSSLLPTTRTKEQLDLDKYLRNNVKF